MSLQPTSDEKAAMDALERAGEASFQRKHGGNATVAVDTPYALPVQWFNDVQPVLSGLWLVKKLLPANGLALIYGHPGSGKSFLALDLAAHVAMGWDWQGRRVKQGLVIYVGAEGAAGLQNRMAAFRQHYQIQTSVPLLLIPSPIDLQSPDADTEKLAQVIRKAAKECGYDPALIVVDTLSKTFGGGKENTDDMATYVANCGRIATEFSACVMPVHHRPKDAESSEPRGHSSLKGGVDTVILIDGDATRRARATKQKDAELGETILFNLHPVTLGMDEDGEAVTSCVVIESSADLNLVSGRKIKLNDNQRIVLEQLHQSLEHCGVPVPGDIPDDKIDRAVFAKVTRVKDWSDRSISALGEAADRKPDSNRTTFARCQKRLQSLKIIDVFGEFVWER